VRLIGNRAVTEVVQASMKMTSNLDETSESLLLLLLLETL